MKKRKEGCFGMVKTENLKKRETALGTLFGTKAHIIVYLLLFLTTEIVFLNKSLQIICGPILAILFIYLYFVKKDTLLVTFFIVIANDALGTIFIGSMSFQYLLMAFVVFEIVQNQKIQLRLFSIMVLAVAMCLQPYLTQVMALRNVFFTVFYLLAIVYQYQKYDREIFMEKMATTVAIIVCLIALHTLITGGVVYKEVEDNIYSQQHQRRGVLGVGVGDPNFSCLLLCTGIACAFNNASFRWYVKLIIVAVTIAAMFVTLSTSGLLSLILVCILSMTVNRKITRGVRRVIIVCLLAIATFQIYLALPEVYHNADVDAYITRMEFKYNALLNNDLYAATTERSGIADRYMNYINNDQSILKQLFGGNSVIELGQAAHNTYISFIMQYGYLGTVGLIAYIVNRLLKTYFAPKDADRKLGFVLKALYIFFIVSLTIYHGSTFAMMFFVLFIL